MTVGTHGHRIAAGWYRAGHQLALSLVRGRVAGDRLAPEVVWTRIVPPRCRFRVRPVDAYGPRDAWHQVAAHAGEATYTRERDRR
jgi:hypothetical protein